MKETQKKWVIKDPINQDIKERFPEQEPIVLQLLFDRGINTQEAIDEFLNPDYERDIHDPFLFKHMREAVDRVLQAKETGELVIIHGDYDADGLSGAVILVSTLNYLGLSNTRPYMPHREKEGYGLNMNTVDLLHKEQAKLIITTDCGISNVDEVARARSLGIDVIVTDHHTQQPKLPDAILLHPKVDGETYPFRDLAGGGVAFKFAQALLKDDTKNHPENAEKNEAFEKWLLDMVAISTVADMVPLIGENRTLVKYGLMVLSKVRRTGLKALMTTARLYPPKYAKHLHLTPMDIGFKIGPRLNAAGRIDHINVAYQLMMCEDETKAMVLAEQLEQTNRDRQAVGRKIMYEALEKIGPVEYGVPSVLIALDAAWSPGVVGLVAGRIMNKLHRPVFILSEVKGKISGSGRSIEGFDCTEALQDAADLLSKFGGHPRACGLTLKENELLPKLRKRFNAFAEKSLTKDDLIPKIFIDSVMTIPDLTWDIFEQLQKMQPFGMGNPEPIFASMDVEVVDLRAVGSEKTHLQITVTHDHKTLRKGIAFGYGDLAATVRIGDKIDIAYTLGVNEWNGNRELQLMIKEIKTKKKS